MLDSFCVFETVYKILSVIKRNFCCWIIWDNLALLSLVLFASAVA